MNGVIDMSVWQAPCGPSLNGLSSGQQTQRMSYFQHMFGCCIAAKSARQPTTSHPHPDTIFERIMKKAIPRNENLNWICRWAVIEHSTSAQSMACVALPNQHDQEIQFQVSDQRNVASIP